MSSKKFKVKRLKEIPGTLPDLTKKHEGCLFYPRCPKREDMCFKAEPVLREIETGHWARCLKADNQK